MRKPPSEAILDTNAILALAKGDVLNYLPEVFKTLIYPPEIDSEIKDKYSRLLFEQAKADWLRSRSSSYQTLPELPPSLRRERADRAVIALSLENPAALVITGDRKIITFLARKGRVALRPERVVVFLKRANVIPSGRVVLERMKSRDYFVPDVQFRELLEDLGETHKK